MKMDRRWFNNGRPTNPHSQKMDHKAAKQVFRRGKRHAKHIYDQNKGDELTQTHVSIITISGM